MSFEFDPFDPQYWENPYDSGVPRADRRSGKYRTYTPSALTGMRLAIGPEVDAQVAAAERAVRALNRGAHQDLGLVSRFLLRSEAIASSYIEGIAPSPRAWVRSTTRRSSSARWRMIDSRLRSARPWNRAAPRLRPASACVVVIDIAR